MFLEDIMVAGKNRLSLNRRKIMNTTVIMSFFLNKRFQTDAPSDLTVVAQSYKNDEGGDFYGTYLTGVERVPVYSEGRDAAKVDVYKACLRVKCPPFHPWYNPFPYWRNWNLSQISEDDYYKYVKISIINQNVSNKCVLR